MKKVEIYTTMFCPFCARAKSLLKSKGVPFSEIDVTTDAAGRQEMSRKSHGATSVPQIFVGGEHLGDCEYIHELDAAGKLDQILEDCR
jgi:glutaredoxin 3